MIQILVQTVKARTIQKQHTKSMITVMYRNVIAFLIIILNSSSCDPDGLTINYYFEQNFHGDVAVVFLENTRKYNNGKGKIDVMVPVSGIVFLDIPYPKGVLNSRFFLKNGQGTYIPIQRSVSTDSNVNSSRNIYFERLITLNCVGVDKAYYVVFFNLGEGLTPFKERYLFERRISDTLCL